MKKKIWMIGMTTAFMVAMTTTAYASTTVEFTNDNKLVYNGTTDMGDAFEGMAPGEEKSQSLTIKNSNSNTTTFFMSADTLEYFENTTTASGGLYDVKLTIQPPTGTAIILYDSSLGGATQAGGTYISDKQGMNAINNSAISNTTYLTTLANGETAQLVLTIGLDGESIRNEYASAFGELGFDFEAMYDTPTGTVIVNKRTIPSSGVRNEVVQTFKNVIVAVKTGDTTTIGVFVAIMIAGAAVLILTGKGKKKAEEV